MAEGLQMSSDIPLRELGHQHLQARHLAAGFPYAPSAGFTGTRAFYGASPADRIERSLHACPKAPSAEIETLSLLWTSGSLVRAPAVPRTLRLAAVLTGT
jgi:hypothetical protein